MKGETLLDRGGGADDFLNIEYPSSLVSFQDQVRVMLCDVGKMFISMLNLIAFVVYKDLDVGNMLKNVLNKISDEE